MLPVLATKILVLVTTDIIKWTYNIAEDSEKLRSLLKNMELRQMILEIDRSRNVKKAIEDAMHSDHFVAFADACLEVVEEQE